MRKVLILLLLLSAAVGLFSQNRCFGVNLSLGSKVCTQPMRSLDLENIRRDSIKSIKGQTTYLNIGVNSKADKLYGLAFNLLTLRADCIKGIAIAGFGNINHYSGEYNGICLGGIMNMSPDGTKGLQVAGLINSSDNIFGIQVSGLIGITDVLRGVQIAPLNFCGDCKGVQIGIVNYCLSEEKSNIFQLGLINLNRSTKIQAIIFGGNSSLMNVGIRFRGKLFYNMVGVGAYSFHLNNKFSWNLSYRSGLWLPITKFLDISGDIGYQHLMTGKNRNESLPGSLYALQARLNLECKIRSKLSLFLSGGYEVLRHYGRNKTHSHQPIIEGGIILF